jgi:hypothetical protein
VAAKSPGVARIEQERSQVPVGSSKGFRWPGSVIQRGRRGKMERESRAIFRCTHAMNGSGNHWIEEGGRSYCTDSVTGRNFG